jgi:rhodanese-related sulfurtransferase
MMPAALDPNITMEELLRQFPGAQRALFRKYHIGGCSACGFGLSETLAGVCARNDNLPVNEVLAEIRSADAADRVLQIEPRELADKTAGGEPMNLLDIRTREEFEAVKMDGAKFFTQDAMQEITSAWSREDLFVIYDHNGERSLDAAAYFQGHGFKNVKALRGGIDAWSAEVDPKLPRYHLERHPERSEAQSRDRGAKP